MKTSDVQITVGARPMNPVARVSVGIFLTGVVACSAAAKPGSQVEAADSTGPSDLIVWSCPNLPCYYRDAQGASYYPGQVTFSTCHSQSQGSSAALDDAFTACADAFGENGLNGLGGSSMPCFVTNQACQTEGMLPGGTSAPAGPGVLWSCSGITCESSTTGASIGHVAYMNCQPVPDPNSGALDNSIAACLVAFGTAAGPVAAYNPNDCQPTSTACTVGAPLQNVVPSDSPVQWTCSGIMCVNGATTLGTVSYTACEPAQDRAVAEGADAIAACNLGFGGSFSAATNPGDCQPTSTPCTPGLPPANVQPTPSGECMGIGAGSGQFSSGSAGCDNCLASNCCMQVNTCVADPQCLAILQCVQACVAGGGTISDCPLSCETVGGVGNALPLQTCEGVCHSAGKCM
jgi:hypothetical protein